MMTLGIFVVGAFLNSLIILVKIKSLKSSNGFDILTINLAVAQIFIILSSLFFLADEIHYKIAHHSWCGLKFYSHTFSILLLGYSSLATLIIALYSKSPSKLHGLIPLIVIWILAIAVAFPNVDVSLYEVPITSGSKFICVLKFKTIEQVKKYRTIMTAIEFFVPSGLIILTLIFAFVLKRKEIEMKNFIIYPMILGFYFIISTSYISLVDFIYFYTQIQIKMPIYTTWKLFYSTISIINAVTCFWIDRNLFYKCLQVLRLDRGTAKISYVNVRNEKESDMSNLCFEQI
jgi:hypothetical protein